MKTDVTRNKVNCSKIWISQSDGLKSRLSGSKGIVCI